MFSFFLRLFVCFVAAKFILKVFEVDSRAYLLGLTALLSVNVYVIDYLAARERRFSPPGQPESPGLKQAAGGEAAAANLSTPEV